MKVGELIKALRKFDKNAEVGYAHSDNSEDEIAGWCLSVVEFDDDLSEKEGYEKIVVIRG